MADRAIRFLLNSKEIRLENCNPNLPVLQYLRDELRRTGTKEGCASGDCGACTVVLAEVADNRLRYKAVNSCITLLSGLHARQLLTVEDLAQGNKLHAVQQAMVDNHGSQCGFCTPGFVMSLFALHKETQSPNFSQARQALAGNLCRCTGYRSIISAAMQTTVTGPDQFDLCEKQTISTLKEIQAGDEFVLSNGYCQMFSPSNISDLARLLLTHPDAHLLAGGTDLVLQVTQQLRNFKTLVYVGNVAELRKLELNSNFLKLGASVTYNEFSQHLASDYPEFGTMIDRLGSPQIRNLATLGGNIGNASPVGDMAPVLIALGASLTLRRGDVVRYLPIEEYFVAYKVTVLESSEFIQSIEIPRAQAGHLLKVYKIAKRFDDDISSLLAVFYLVLENNKVKSVRIAFGGMAAIPKRAKNCEQKLLGQSWNRDSITLASAALELDFEPITDMRASASYRLQVAKNLLHKCYLETKYPDMQYSVFVEDSNRTIPSPVPEVAERNSNGRVGVARNHESADKHVSGSAVYVDDRPPLKTQLHAAIGQSTIAHGLIRHLDLTAVKSAEGVIEIITAADVPGQLDIGPVFPGDPVLVSDRVEFFGQAIFVVAAVTHELARRAVKLAKIKYEELEPVLDIQQALNLKNFVRPGHKQKRGDAEQAILGSLHQLQGELAIGGQEHFYLEGQVSSAQPGEDGDMEIFTSSQHPSEVQKLVAGVLGINLNQVNVEVRRMGGAFGGKETNAAPGACLAALLANKSQRPVKLRLSRGDDMVLTGKRHPFENSYHVGFDDQGQITGIEITLNADCGYSPDLSDAIVDRAMFHCDNAYYLDSATVVGNRCKTNTVSNTAFRGFGGPQGMLTIECVMDDIARFLEIDPLAVRLTNLYGINQRNFTHYHQRVENNKLRQIMERLADSADYVQRRENIVRFNSENRVLKRGIALMPVKFGISFTATHLNQAGALIHIYVDGSIHLNHGGTEMGQGLFTKVAQVVGEEFQVDEQAIKVSATRTDKVPNTSPTAASAGSDLNGKAAQDAARKIKSRLVAFACDHFDVSAEQVRFADNQVLIGELALDFAEFIELAYFNRISLSATGYYRTPKIHYDRASASGRPFFYFVQAAAVSEVMVDTLTGEYRVLRTDILHDVGRSLNPAVDIGQIEGGFVQGLGWLTTEELLWDEKGSLLTSSPATYKIPSVSDAPEIFNIELIDDEANSEDTIYHSKAVGEPPLMLAISVWLALRDSISSLSDYRISPRLDIPATPERVFNAVTALMVNKQGVNKQGVNKQGMNKQGVNTGGEHRG